MDLGRCESWCRSNSVPPREECGDIIRVILNTPPLDAEAAGPAQLRYRKALVRIGRQLANLGAAQVPGPEPSCGCVVVLLRLLGTLPTSLTAGLGKLRVVNHIRVVDHIKDWAARRTIRFLNSHTQ